jgi:hypothetical protein
VPTSGQPGLPGSRIAGPNPNNLNGTGGSGKRTGTVRRGSHGATAKHGDHGGSTDYTGPGDTENRVLLNFECRTPSSELRTRLRHFSACGIFLRPQAFPAIRKNLCRQHY